MIEQIIIAFENQDYITARKLIEELLKTDPNEPFAQLYLAKLYQVNGQLELAETMYRKILRSTTNAKILSQARQNLQLLINQEKERRRNALEKAKSDPQGKAESVLILEPINNDLRANLAPKFAKVMQIDNYSARMILSSKSWRLYRTGKLGEINFYVEELTKVEIPCFALTIDEIKKIHVYKVNYFQVFDQQITVVCTDESSQTGTFTFDLTEISQRVEGLLPIFEEVVDLDFRRKLQRKTKTLDYAKICDLHLPQRNSILRMCDYLYDFQEGIRLGESNRYSWENTTLKSWNNLMKLFEEKLGNQTVWRDFTNFAELALDPMEMLQHFESHIDLFRKEDTLWDQAFQLYSGLVFLQQ